jgi:16S rRNA (guanine(966)-N(2))-methyltransferase RsmD
MRISGGEFRGRTLRTPKGEATRPTSGMVRETLFNMLAPDLPDARLLDLFAGCGSVGLEALGRGAAFAAFVENARPALDCLRGNIAALGVTEHTLVLPYPVARAIDYMAKKGEQFDLIFLDPPFHDVRAYQTVFEKVANILAPDGQVIAQHDARVKLPEEAGQLVLKRQRDIGDNVLSFYGLNQDLLDY